MIARSKRSSFQPRTCYQVAKTDYWPSRLDRSAPRDDMHGRYLLRRGDEKKTVIGSPMVPQEHKTHLLERPLEAKITRISKSVTRPSVSDWNFRDTFVVLDGGRAGGLLVGMELHVIHPEHLVESAQITKVEDHTADAIMTQMENETGPSVGWKLSTLPSWRVRHVHSATRPTDDPVPETQPSSH